jgi:hypothetical protein
LEDRAYLWIFAGPMSQVMITTLDHQLDQLENGAPVNDIDGLEERLRTDGY